MTIDTKTEPIELVPNRVVEIICELNNLTGIPDEAFSPLEEIDPPPALIEGNGEAVTSASSSRLPKAPPQE
jgi:hypothetical protein